MGGNEMKKNCKHCGVEFETRHNFQVFCSKKCNTNHYAKSGKGKEKQKEYYKKTYKPIEKKIHLKVCSYCNKEFETSYSFKIFCSKWCKDTSYNNSEAGKRSVKKYRDTEKYKITDDIRRQSPEYKEARKAFDKKWIRENREKVRAHIIARKIPRQQCEVKDCMKLGERHHEDYTKPEEVMFLCGQHHKDIGR